MERIRSPISRLFPLPQRWRCLLISAALPREGKPQTPFGHGGEGEDLGLLLVEELSQSLSMGPGNVERKSPDFCVLCFSSEH